MPIYEYKCTVCDLRFERRQPVDDDPIQSCPSCRGYTRRVLSPAGIIFKGSGFYATDNGRGGASARRDRSPDESESSKPASTPSSSEKSNGSSDGAAKSADKVATR